jgi:hypothetical protein
MTATEQELCRDQNERNAECDGYSGSRNWQRHGQSQDQQQGAEGTIVHEMNDHADIRRLTRQARGKALQ